MLKTTVLAVGICPLEKIFNSIGVPIINIVPHGRASNIFGVVVFGSIDNNTAIFYDYPSTQIQLSYWEID